ncbi:MAG: TrmH family RNA methyltransferase [Clostridia bacterium]|nr:TrmH family RNA methyltransferase [Clostridia bacterium]
MPRLEPYKKTLDYSYCLGVFPSLKLLEYRPSAAMRLLLHSEGMDSEGVGRLRERCAALGVREETADKILRRESRKDNCFAALVFGKYEAALDPQRPHVVLHHISDSGNLGTIIRACLGFGIRDIAIIRPCVDAFEPHTLRASMGAFFAVNARMYASFEDYRRAYPEHTLFPFMLDGAIPLDEAVRGRPPLYALVFGNEASGLPPEFARMGQSVFIPQGEEIDSLNLAVAVSVGVYAFTR